MREGNKCSQEIKKKKRKKISQKERNQERSHAWFLTFWRFLLDFLHGFYCLPWQRTIRTGKSYLYFSMMLRSKTDINLFFTFTIACIQIGQGEELHGPARGARAKIPPPWAIFPPWAWFLPHSMHTFSIFSLFIVGTAKYSPPLKLSQGNFPLPPPPSSTPMLA